ncbi:response regulator [Sphingomonas sp. NSE70-1]|uniref:histidine kinase n=1 Tax=Sphingomonas caseinilyticus TaxID=2908205 RepID=A0ABT0RXS3_9SPHN|nr:response regulator [Sphingomonas caseinilyticus]MCL6699696.1 response regulator [Sphingomonas caseinilyticus]
MTEMTRSSRIKKSSSDTAASAPPAGAKILLVDDDERNLMALSELLKDIATVVTATSGKAALRHLLKDDFAVILLDVFMPGIDGYETAGLIREREQTARIPIIFLSAVNKETEHLMRGYAMGAVDYVFKPVDPLILKSKVSVFVDLYNVRAQVEEKSVAEQKLRDANFKAELDRLQIARELQATREREAAIIRSIPILLYMEPLGNQSRRPDFVSGDFTAMTGFDFDEAQQDPELWERRLHPEDRERVLEAIGASRETGRLSIEYRWQCADGSYKHFHDQAVLVSDVTGEASQFAGTLTDVTEQRLLEGRLIHAQKMDAIGQLTGGVAHDFNNLLSAVIGGIHLLERRVDFEQREQRIIDQMRHAAEQGAELVRRMMAFARKQDLKPTSVSASSLCKSVAGLVEHTLGGTITVDWQCPDELQNIYADKAQLELALVNLILNSRDAMPNGGTVEVQMDNFELDATDAESGLKVGTYIRISVSDQGLGIPEELVSRVTEPFFTTKEAGKGTGLGLSMVAGFVQQSNGLLKIDNRTGGGTRIELFLPATDQPAHAPQALEHSNVRTSGTMKAVLLVDDDESVRTVLGEQLRELGFKVDEVGDGKTAIERLKSNGSYDVLLTDFAMPGMNGLDTINRAMIERPALQALLMTGYADEGAVAHMRETVPIIRKPINVRDLLGHLA